jgi:hypothetical protein
MQIRRNRH